MQPDFWLESWQVGGVKTSFHRRDVHPYVVKYMNPEALQGKRVLVPLCGKTNDLIWSSHYAEHVIGIELSEIAVLQFFAENELVYQKPNEYTYQSGNIIIYQKNMFELTSEHIGRIDWIYDRASLIALPKNMRGDYVRLLDSWTHIGTKTLLITLEYEPDMGEPPFSVTPAEVVSHYGKKYFIAHVEKSLLPEHRMVQKFNLTFLIEHGFMLTKHSL
jgi:thiopurine S-methyltransferase